VQGGFFLSKKPLGGIDSLHGNSENAITPRRDVPSTPTQRHKTMNKEEVQSLKHTISPEEASRQVYDAVIVGSGISGSIMAKELTKAGCRVLVLEAGPGRDFSQNGYQHYLENFYSSPSKDNNAPFLRNPNAEMPRGPDCVPLRPGCGPVDSSYLVQNGPFITDTVYSRVLGGTTVHFEAKAIRMLREDFRLRSSFGQGLDWPITLDTLMPYYRRAEYEMGVSGDVASQKQLGAEFDSGYVYPMVELKASYLDNIVAQGVRGMKVELEGEDFDISLSTFPQAKNADPNPDYAKWNEWEDYKPYRPKGAISVHQDETGERCQGNTNCVPLCPVQARFDARKILIKAISSGRTDLLTQAVASRVHFDGDMVSGIETKIYESPESPAYRTFHFKGRIFILAANAVENARLMLASAVLNERPVNDLIGRHLMDHPYLLSWALLRQNAGVGRGPTCTSGFCGFRHGGFRRKMAAFASDIHNDGWGWATGAPNADLIDAVDKGNKFGSDLRGELIRRISRQLLLAFMIELPADPENRVTVNPQYIDALGNMRPIFTLRLPDYSLNTVEFVRRLSQRIFQRLGAEDYTRYDPADYGYLTYNGQGYALRGGNHLAGTHVMGTDGANSVVDENQKSWEHPNLYLVSPGSLCSIGSSNTTLTTAALAFKTAQSAIAALKTIAAPTRRTI
jgi:choline dehydrogenase-like flavoprotein